VQQRRGAGCTEEATQSGGDWGGRVGEVGKKKVSRPMPPQFSRNVMNIPRDLTGR